MTATSAVWGVWTNGSEIEHYCKPKGESAIYGDRLNNVPARGQRLEDAGKLTRGDLVPYSGAMLKASLGGMKSCAKLKRLPANCGTTKPH